jgi:hypothetical protein
METYINVNAKFDDKEEHRVDSLLRCFTRLSESQQDYEAKLEELWGSFKSINHGIGSKMEWLVKTYGPYLLCDQVTAVSSTQINFRFTCGSDGIEFGRDFAYVLYTFGAANSDCSFRYDEDPNGSEKSEYTFNRASIETS